MSNIGDCSILDVFDVSMIRMRYKDISLLVTTSNDQTEHISFYIHANDTITCNWPYNSLHSMLYEKCVKTYIDFFRNCTKNDIGKVLPANKSETISTLIKLL